MYFGCLTYLIYKMQFVLIMHYGPIHSNPFSSSTFPFKSVKVNASEERSQNLSHCWKMTKKVFSSFSASLLFISLGPCGVRLLWRWRRGESKTAGGQEGTQPVPCWRPRYCCAVFCTQRWAGCSYQRPAHRCRLQVICWSLCKSTSSGWWALNLKGLFLTVDDIQSNYFTALKTLTLLVASCKWSLTVLLQTPMCLTLLLFSPRSMVTSISLLLRFLTSPRKILQR